MAEDQQKSGHKTRSWIRQNPGREPAITVDGPVSCRENLLPHPSFLDVGGPGISRGTVTKTHRPDKGWDPGSVRTTHRPGGSQ